MLSVEAFSSRSVTENCCAFWPRREGDRSRQDTIWIPSLLRPMHFSEEPSEVVTSSARAQFLSALTYIRRDNLERRSISVSALRRVIREARRFRLWKSRAGVPEFTYREVISRHIVLLSSQRRDCVDVRYGTVKRPQNQSLDAQPKNAAEHQTRGECLVGLRKSVAAWFAVR